MKKIKGWSYNLDEDVYVQDGFVIGDLDGELGTDKHGDVKNRNIYDPNFVRWSNTFEVAQQVRFMTVMTWVRSHLTNIAASEGKKRKKLLIDLGCSRSFIYRRWKGNMNYFSWPIIHYWGVDSSLKRINEGRVEIIKKKNDSLVYFVGDLNREMQFPGKADLLICLEVLEHIPEKNVGNLLSTIKNNLRKDGMAIISSPNPESSGSWVWGDESQHSHHKEYTWEEAKKLFEDHGLKVQDYTGVLPDRNYFRRSSFGKLRAELVKHFPAPWVNNILLLAEPSMDIKRQWICSVTR